MLCYGNLQLAPVWHVANEVRRTENPTIAAAGVIDGPAGQKNGGEKQAYCDGQHFQDKSPRYWLDYI